MHRRILGLLLTAAIVVTGLVVPAFADDIPDSFIPWVKYRYRENSDTVGWLYIPGTSTNAAVVKNPESRTNNYYLLRDFYQQADKRGTYCADQRVDFGGGLRSDLPFNTTIYAHNFDDNPDGIRFAQLKKYLDPEYAAEHPYVYFSTGAEDMVWEIFAVFDTTVDFPYVWPDFPEDIRQKVMNVVYQSSIYDYGVRISAQDKILTLSTCTFTVNGKSLNSYAENDYRYVVMARLVGENETLKEKATFTVNESPLPVESIPDIQLPWLQ